MNVFLFFAVLILPNVLCEIKYNVTDSLQKKLALRVLLNKVNTSVVVSTLALRYPLCMLASVAVGETKAELMSALGIDKESKLTSCYSEIKEAMTILKQVDLIFVNKIYLNYSNDIDPQFIANSSHYGIDVDRVGFNYPTTAVSFINKRISEATLRRIPDILDRNDINLDTTMLIVNALQFNGIWTFPFQLSRTKMKRFRHCNGSISMVPMMVKEEEIQFFDDDLNYFKIFTILYHSVGAKITFVVPYSASALPYLLSQMATNPEYLDNAMKKMKWKTVKIEIPRFKIKTQINWTGFLKEISLNKTLNSNSTDLNRILKSNGTTRNMHLSKVKQKLFVQVDEYGVVRPTGMSEAMDYWNEQTYKNKQTDEVIADKPFYFAIGLQTESNVKDSKTYDIFNGVYYGPE